MNTNQTITLTTQQLQSKAYMGDKVFVNGVRKSYLQLGNMKGKSYQVTMEKEGAVNILKTVNHQTLK